MIGFIIEIFHKKKPYNHHASLNVYTSFCGLDDDVLANKQAISVPTNKPPPIPTPILISPISKHPLSSSSSRLSLSLSLDSSTFLSIQNPPSLSQEKNTERKKIFFGKNNKKKNSRKNVARRHGAAPPVVPIGHR